MTAAQHFSPAIENSQDALSLPPEGASHEQEWHSWFPHPLHARSSHAGHVYARVHVHVIRRHEGLGLLESSAGR